MGVLTRLTTTAPARLRAAADERIPTSKAFFSPAPDSWVAMVSAAGVRVTPELAMTLSAFYCGVTMIAYDMATLPCQVFAARDDGGKDRIKPYYGEGIDSSNGIRSLAYMLRWQPNPYQTAAEFFTAMLAQFLLRGVAYAEEISNAQGFLVALLPRHPDRVFPERLPSGRLRYRVLEADGSSRYVLQDEMFVVRDLTLDGLTPASRVAFGANAIGTSLAAEQAAGKFFKSGMTAAKLATYKGGVGGMEEEEEAALHASLTRFATGVNNNFGLMLVPDDITVTSLGVEPEKAQMMAAREYGLREVARLLRIPPHKLAIPGTTTYASQVQSQLEYVQGCLKPIAVTIEQAIQRDLVVAKDAYLAEFQLAGLLRGDFDAQSQYIERLIRNRVMRPSEARMILNMNPDPALDALSEKDFRPGEPAGRRDDPEEPDDADESEEDDELEDDESDEEDSPPAPRRGRAALRLLLAVHDNAERCVRRERAAVEKLARKYAADVAGWEAGLQDYYADHARFVAQTMRIPMGVARAYAAQHGAALLAGGAPLQTDDWEREEADALASLAFEDV